MPVTSTFLRPARYGALPRAVFVHVPKAAGSTLIYALRRLYGREHVWVRDGRGWPMDVPENAPISAQVWAGHMGYGLHNSLGVNATYLSVLRSPSSRLESAYQYIGARPRNPWYDRVNAMSLRAFTTGPPIAPEFDNGQLRRLLPEGQSIPIGGCTEEQVEEVLRRCDDNQILLGVQDRFDTSLLYFARYLGWPAPYYWTQNQRRTGGEAQAPVESSTDRDSLDALLYEGALLRLEQRVQIDEALSPRSVRLFQQRNEWGYRSAATPLMAYRKGSLILRKKMRRLTS